MVIFEALEEDMPDEPDMPAPRLMLFDTEQLDEIIKDESGESLDSFVSIKKEHAESDDDEIIYKSEEAYLRRKSAYSQKCSYDELQKTPEQEDEEEKRLFGW